jgi:hypothetical protein
MSLQPPPVDDDDEEFMKKKTLRAEIYWARKRVADRFACLVEGHMWNEEEIGEDDLVPCLRCDRWVHPE